MMTQLLEGPTSAHDLTVALSGQRTELSFQRTRMASDRTLMAIIRTALSLIGFGFTIFSFFRTLAKAELLGDGIRDGAPAQFGLALVILGVVLLALGIVSDVHYVRALLRQYGGLLDRGLIGDSVELPRSLIVATAILLLLIGLVAALSIMMRL